MDATARSPRFDTYSRRNLFHLENFSRSSGLSKPTSCQPHSMISSPHTRRLPLRASPPLASLSTLTGILALGLGYQISSADPRDEERKSAHCGRKEKVRSPIIHRARALADNVLAPSPHHPSSIPPSSLHSSTITCSPRQKLNHAAQPFAYPTTWANDYTKDLL